MADDIAAMIEDMSLFRRTVLLGLPCFFVDEKVAARPLVDTPASIVAAAYAALPPASLTEPVMVGPLVTQSDPADYSDLRPQDWNYGVRLPPMTEIRNSDGTLMGLWGTFTTEVPEESPSAKIMRLVKQLADAREENVLLRAELAALKPAPKPQPTDNAFARRHDGRAPDRREP